MVSGRSANCLLFYAPALRRKYSAVSTVFNCPACYCLPSGPELFVQAPAAGNSGEVVLKVVFSANPAYALSYFYFSNLAYTLALSMRLLIAIFFALIFSSAKAQQDLSKPWIAFSDSTTELYGYKDLQGNIRIKPQYAAVETDTFKTIAIILNAKEGWVAISKEQEILFKPFIFDNGPDEFSNGLIRIEKDKKVGFADETGKIIIPPIYDLALPFHGNYTAFYSGGKQICAGENIPEADCEHFEWIGGKWGIINKANDTLIAPSLEHQDLGDLNLTSLTTIKPKSRSFVALQGKTKTYYLENVRFTFQACFQNFLEKAKIKDRSYFASVMFSNLECTYCLLNTKEERKAMIKAKKYYPGNAYTEDRTAEVIPTKTFLNQDFALIFSPETIQGLADSTQTEIFIDFENISFHYTNPNSAFLKEITQNKSYYKFNAVLSHYTRRKIRFQEHFNFIKTEKGIKFISYSRTTEGYTSNL